MATKKLSFSMKDWDKLLPAHQSKLREAADDMAKLLEAYHGPLRGREKWNYLFENIRKKYPLLASDLGWSLMAKAISFQLRLRKDVKEALKSKRP